MSLPEILSALVVVTNYIEQKRRQAQRGERTIKIT